MLLFLNVVFNHLYCFLYCSYEIRRPIIIDQDNDGYSYERTYDSNGNELENWLAANGGATATDGCTNNLTWTNNFDEVGLSDDCGATGGGRGGPNARAFAAMANHSAVRESLVKRGVEILNSTHFVGAYHNTCDDSMLYYDTDLIPQLLVNDFDEVRELLAHACQCDAHERCRRFESAPRHLEIKNALYHAEEHAADLGQPRPEYGHASNAVCVIGRRETSRGLFLDRRAFLISYDPIKDESGEALGPLLAAAGPVGAGISLEYYFSFIDPDGYGCGTKLPHNITGLIGVMDGHASDLRTGLPWQMVEIHEPMRLLIIVESTVEILTQIVDKFPGVAQLVLNGWVQLVSVDPSTRVMNVFEGSAFVPYCTVQQELPIVDSSIDWYAGHRDHLGVARIERGMSHAV